MSYIDTGPRPLPDPLPHRQMTLAYLFPPLMLLSAVAGAVIALTIDDNRPAFAEDKSFVNIDGHDGEVLVVESSTEPIEVRWCQQDNHACHGMMG